MPFVSKAQMRACYARKRSAEKMGIKPSWNCYEWAKETNYKSLPEGNIRPATNSSKQKTNKIFNGHRVWVGPKGGEFIRTRGKDGVLRRIYIKK